MSLGIRLAGAGREVSGHPTFRANGEHAQRAFRSRTFPGVRVVDLIDGFWGGVERAKAIRAYARILLSYFNGGEMSDEDRERLKRYGIGTTLAKLLVFSDELVAEERRALRRALRALRRLRS